MRDVAPGLPAPTIPDTETTSTLLLRDENNTPTQTDAYIKYDRVGRVGGRRTSRQSNKAGVYARADAEVDLIVQLYFDGISLARIARMLGRDAEYVSRVFHSPRGRMLCNERKRDRTQLAEELQDRMAYAAQQALDNIIELSNSAASEAIRLSASETLLEGAVPKQRIGAAVQVNIGDDVIATALRAMREVDAKRSRT